MLFVRNDLHVRCAHPCRNDNNCVFFLAHVVRNTLCVMCHLITRFVCASVDLRCTLTLYYVILAFNLQKVVAQETTSSQKPEQNPFHRR